MQNTATDAAELVRHFRSRGIRLWTERGQLRYQAPKGSVSRGHLDTLTAAKEQLIRLLETDRTHAQRHPLTDLTPQAPLAHSQLAHWNRYRLHQRPSVRQIASATRLHGALQLDVLKQSASAVLQRHSALRTHIVTRDGALLQQIDDKFHCEIRMRDLSAHPADRRESELQQLIDAAILEPTDVTRDPLITFSLIRLDQDEHVLVIAMEHMISDMISMSILLEDLFHAYHQVARGQAIYFDNEPAPFSEYAASQHQAHELWEHAHRAYWTERLERWKRIPFPSDSNASAVIQHGWTTVPFKIGHAVKAQLQTWCRQRRTTLVMGALAIYAALVSRWCNVREIAIPYMFDGRVDRRFARTIGSFASVLYIHARLLPEDDGGTFLDRITRAYCEAYRHADHSFWETQTPPPGFVLNCGFNWLPRAPSIASPAADSLDSPRSLRLASCRSIPFAHPMLRALERDSEPVMVLAETAEGIEGEIGFPLNRFSVRWMEYFAAQFLRYATVCAREPWRRIQDLPPPP
ncbi:MAG TPA: condensation domain-containing protein [Steroidobacteraceae bacterium]